MDPVGNDPYPVAGGCEGVEESLYEKGQESR